MKSATAKDRICLLVAASMIGILSHNIAAAFTTSTSTARTTITFFHQSPDLLTSEPPRIYSHKQSDQSRNRRRQLSNRKTRCWLSSWTPPDFDSLPFGGGGSGGGGGNDGDETPLNVKVNEFFKQTVPPGIREKFDVRLEDSAFVRTEFDTIELLTSPPGSPGMPRPLWLVILGSVPSGLLWYGFYKFCVEEELFQMELDKGGQPKGFGGYGTLGPFVYFSVLGPLAVLFHIPGGLLWSNVGIAFIYYTQFLLYERVNELYTDIGEEPPLTVWWCLPIFFPFDLIVGLRQVHFLSQYNYATRLRGRKEIPKDPVVQFFPFIGKPTLTWPEFLLTPSLWFAFLSGVKPIDRSVFPETLQEFLDWGEGKGLPTDGERRLRRQERQQQTRQSSRTFDVTKKSSSYFPPSPPPDTNYFR